MKGETTALTPPAPILMRLIDTAKPPGPAPSRSTAGIEVTSCTIDPTAVKLFRPGLIC